MRDFDSDVFVELELEWIIVGRPFVLLPLVVAGRLTPASYWTTFM